MSSDLNQNYNEHVASNIIVVWLDSNIHTTEDCLETQKYLRRIFINLMVFDDMDECNKYLCSVTIKKIFLIVSGRLGAAIVPIIHSLPQIESIYIYCSDKLSHERWAKNYCKIRGVFDDKSLLLSKLCFTVTSRFNNSSVVSVFNTTSSTEKSIRNLHKHKTTFMWFQLLLEILLRMPTTNKSQSEMLTLCRVMYQNNSVELQNIEEFEGHYAPGQAIFWYTRDCFVYRLMNALLRTESIDMIYTFRYFIKDLHEALQKLHYEYVQSLRNVGTLTVYRGQRMSMTELEELKENVHNLIAMNTFLSTTLQKHIAMLYAGGCIECPYVEPVLFEIDIKITDEMETKPFAKITEQSNFSIEDEVLFSMGAIFQIDSVSQLADGMWIVKLHLTSVEDDHLSSLNKYMKKNIREETTLLDLGNFLLTMGEDDKAIEYFKLYLREDPHNLKDMSYIYTQIGYVYFKKELYELALFNYETALDYQESSQPPNYLWLPQAYENIGYANEKMGSNHIALKYYQQQLQFYRNCTQPNEELIMKVQQKLNSFYNEVDNFEEKELEYSHQRLGIYLKTRPSNHPDLINIYSNIGFAHGCSGDYVNASINYEKAFDICLASLPPNHEQTRITYYNVAYCQCMTNHYENSLKNYEIAIELELKSQSPKLLFLAKIYNGRGYVYHQQKIFPSAIENYAKAIQICSENLTSRSEYYQNLGCAYLQSEENENAVKALEKALQIEEDAPVCRPSTIVKLCTSIGHGYFALNNYISAINNYRKALETNEYVSASGIDLKWTRKTADGEVLLFSDRSLSHAPADEKFTAQQYKISLETYSEEPKTTERTTGLMSTVSQSYDDFIFTENYEDFVKICVQNKEFENALQIYEKVVNIKLNRPSKNIQVLSAIYIKMAFLYIETKNYQSATTYFEKSLELTPDILQTDPNTASTFYTQLGYAMFHKKNYEEALHLCNKALMIETNRVSQSQFTIAVKQKDVGIIYGTMKQYEAAISNLECAIDILTSCTSEQRNDLVSFFENLAHLYYESGNLDKAIECSSKLLALTLEWGPSTSPSLAKAYSMLGIFSFRNKNYQESIINWEKAVEIQLILSPLNSDTVTHTYINLANACVENNSYAQALMYYERSLEIQQQMKSPTTSLMASVYNSVGNIHYKQNNYLQSIVNYTQAINKLGEDTNLKTVYLDNLGEAYIAIEKYGEAIETYAQCLEIKLKLAPFSTVTVVQSYTNLASAYSKNRNYAQSLRYYERALETEQRLDSPRLSSMASTHNSIGNIHYEQNNYALSIISYTQAIKLLDKDENIPVVYFDNLGGAYKMDGRYTEALENYAQSLEIKLKSMPFESLPVAESYAYLGDVYFRIKDYKMSIDNYQKAIEVGLSVTPLTNSLIDWYGNLSEVYYTTHDFEKAQFSCEIALEKEQLVSNRDPHILIGIYQHLSWNYYLKGDYETALLWDRKVLKMRLIHLQPNDKQIAIAFNNIGKTLHRLAIYDESQDYFRKAIDTFSKSVPTSNDAIVNTYKNLGELFEMRQQYNDAAESYGKSIEFLILQRPLDQDFYLLYKKIHANNTRFYVLKRLLIMQNIQELQLE